MIISGPRTKKAGASKCAGSYPIAASGRRV